VKHTTNVIIVGGGIQGLSLAYHLASLGLTDVTLLERNTLGSGSSGRSAAIIGFALQTEACLPLTRWSHAAFLRFHDELAADPGFDPIGCLILAGPRRAPELRRRHQLLCGLGIESHLLGRDAILALTPGLYLEDVEIGLYDPQGACIDPHSVMMAYARHARRLGVTILEGTEVLCLQIEGDRITGVETSAGPIAAPSVINAAGFRARQVAAWAGLDLPITNSKRHIFFTGPVDAYSGPIPFTYEQDADSRSAITWYMRREGPGLLIGMGSVESDEEDPTVDWAFLDEVVDYSLHRAPPLTAARVHSGWAGLRPLTPDDNPILGPAPLAGFWNDCGWGGHGIMHAPAAGRALAEWILQGRPSSVDLSLPAFTTHMHDSQPSQ
jgi:sarcosine oxidase subunit beta